MASPRPQPNGNVGWSGDTFPRAVIKACLDLFAARQRDARNRGEGGGAVRGAQDNPVPRPTARETGIQRCRIPSHQIPFRFAFPDPLAFLNAHLHLHSTP